MKRILAQHCPPKTIGRAPHNGMHHNTMMQTYYFKGILPIFADGANTLRHAGSTSLVSP